MFTLLNLPASDLALENQTLSQENSTILISLQEAQNLALDNNKLIKKSQNESQSSLYKKRAMFTNFLPKFESSASYLLRSESTKMTLKGAYLPTYNFNPNTGELEANVFINPQNNQVIYGEDGYPIFNQYALFPDKDLEILPKAGFTSAVSLKQAIYTGGKISTAYKMSSLGEKAAQLKLAYDKEEILYNTETAYWKVVSLMQKTKLTEKYLTLVQNVLDKLQDSYDVGLSNKNQLLQAKVKYNEVLLLKEEAQNGLELATMALLQQIGLPLNTTLIPGDSLANIPPTENLDNFQISDYIARNDFKMLKLKNDITSLNINLERSEYLPQIGIVASYNYLNYKLNDVQHDDFSANAMAQVTLPLFQWGQGIFKVKEAKAKYKADSFNLANSSELMQLQIQQAKNNVENKSSKFTLAQSALTQADEYLELETDNYSVGMTSLTDLLNAQALWQKAYSDYIDAQLELNLAYKALEKSSGKYHTK